MTGHSLHLFMTCLATTACKTTPFLICTLPLTDFLLEYPTTFLKELFCNCLTLRDFKYFLVKTLLVAILAPFGYDNNFFTFCWA